jgi:hypothetical protein
LALAARDADVHGELVEGRREVLEHVSEIQSFRGPEISSTELRITITRLTAAREERNGCTTATFILSNLPRLKILASLSMK